MVEITAYQVEKLKDPFGILAGERYEFILDLDIAEDDELYQENGVCVRAVLKVEGEEARLVTCDLMEQHTNRLLDFVLEEDEEEAVSAFCKEHLQDAEE